MTRLDRGAATHLAADRGGEAAHLAADPDAELLGVVVAAIAPCVPPIERILTMNRNFPERLLVSDSESHR
jgi:hypothetical protein